MWVSAQAVISKGTGLLVSGMVLFKQGEIVTSSVVRVLARFARGPGFKSLLGHVLFPPL